MVRCTRCGLPNGIRRGTTTWCASCWSTSRATYNRKGRTRRRCENAEWYLDQKRGACSDCGRSFDPRCMDFDHTQTNKLSAPADLMGKGRNRAVMLSEIKKCQLVCANCHRIRTFSRIQRRTYRPSELSGVIDRLKLGHACLSCGENFPPECMDFDHRDPTTKKFSIGRMRPKSMKFLPQLLEEIQKCDLICHNCHRLRTSKTFGWQSSAEVQHV
jgi:hypothetical protein